MTVCFEYCGGGSSHWPHQQGFRLLELQSLTALGGHDASQGAIAASAAEGIHPAINVSLNTQGVVFLVDSAIEPGDRLANGVETFIVTNKLLFNGQGYSCLSRNARDSYQGIWVRECDVFPAALPRSTVPRPHAPMVGAQRSVMAAQARRGTVYANDPNSRPRADTVYANDPNSRPRADTVYANDPNVRPRADTVYANDPTVRPRADTVYANDPAVRPRADTVYANVPPNPAFVRRPQAGRHRARFNGG